MTRLRLLPAVLGVGLALPAAAQVFETFPYEMVSAFGANNERDVNAESCDLEFGCISNTGTLCADDPNQGCVLSTVPAGRCVTGNRPDNLWPSKGGECAGTSGYFKRGPATLGNIQENSLGGYPCVTDDYAAALAIYAEDPIRDDTDIVALETVNGPSSMCPGNGTCAHKRCSIAPAGIGVVACVTDGDCVGLDPNGPTVTCVQANDNTANCQAFDPKPSVCFSDNLRKCGIDQDCAKSCSGGAHDGAPCETSLLDCKDGVGTNPGDCVPIPGDCILTRCESDPSIGCVNDADCGQICSDGFRDGLECQDSLPDCQLDPNDPGECVVEFPGGCSVPANDFEPGVCGGTQARCSDGDPELNVGGLGRSLCTDIVIIHRVDGSQNCGRNAGAPIRSSPRDVRENPPFLFTPQREPGTGFLGSGVIRTARTTGAVQIQDADDAMTNTLGIRRISTLAPTFWQDAFFSADDVNGALDNVSLDTRCNPPEAWETQLPVQGNCSAPNEAIFCVADGDCPGGTCENLLFCHERMDPNQPELGPALDSVAFLWQRDIVDNEPIPAGLPDVFRDPDTGDPIWSTDPKSPTCPPICGTEYDHTTFEQEAITAVGAADRGSGIQLALDSLSGIRAGAGDMLSVDAVSTVAFVNTGDIRCQLGGQDPNDLVNLGTCTSSRVPCDPENDTVCAPGETCEGCGGRLIRPGDPLAPIKGLNPQAVPIGYDDLGIDALKLIENGRLGVLNGFPATQVYSVFSVGTTGAAAAQFTDHDPCDPQGDRCVIGQTSPLQPGSVGIGAGGTFKAGQRFAHGGSNRSGGPVSWDPEDPPGPGPIPFVRVGTFGPGADGIPGCMGNNSPRNNASDACRKRLARGQETGQRDPDSSQGKWGFCQGGTQGWLPEPPPPCQRQTQFFSCQFPYGNDFLAICSPKVLEFNTGKDDPEILVPVVDEGLGPRINEGSPAPGVTSRFPASGSGPVIPNPSAPTPTFHLIGATTLRDLDLLEGVDNADIVVKADVTFCPLNLHTGHPECSIAPPPCFGMGGDTDADTVCDNLDNCPTVANTDQDDTEADGVGDVCDNCTLVANPRVTNPEPWMTLTGGQRDDDADGFGNKCDGRFTSCCSVVGQSQVAVFLTALGKSRTASTCGTSGTDSCARYDLDEGPATNIGQPDIQVFIGLLGNPPGPRCAVCPLPPCSGPNCPP